MQHGEQVVHEIDAENMVRVINGVDTLANIRNALGI
jgi:P2 family phage contractile tail tube protein